MRTMSAEKSSVLGLLAAMIALGVFAALGSLWLGLAFVAALSAVVVVHARVLCATCGNLHCALNARSPEFLFGERDDAGAKTPTKPGDTRWVPFALAAVLAPGLWGAWLFHPAAVAAVLALLAASFVPYRRTACASCTNDCPAKPRCSAGSRR